MVILILLSGFSDIWVGFLTIADSVQLFQCLQFHEVLCPDLIV